MSKSNNINIFVKGKKNQFFYSVSSSNFEVLYQSESKLDVGEDISPIKADILAIKEGLNFVKENRGNGVIPNTPIISLFTCYENNYYICNGKKNADKFRDELKDINKIKSDLARWQGDHDHVKILWIPVGFKNLMN